MKSSFIITISLKSAAIAICIFTACDGHIHNISAHRRIQARPRWGIRGLEAVADGGNVDLNAVPHHALECVCAIGVRARARNYHGLVQHVRDRHTGHVQ